MPQSLELKPRSFSRAKAGRRQGLVPVVLMNREHKGEEYEAHAFHLKQALDSRDEHGRVSLSINGRDAGALVKGVDFDALNRQLLHITFQEVSDTDVVKVEVPVVLTGHSDDTDTKGVEIIKGAATVTIEGPVASIPDHVEVDASKLHVGEHLEASDIPLPEGVSLASDAHATVATVETFPEFVEPEPEITGAPEPSGETAGEGGEEVTASGDASAEGNETSPDPS